MNKFSYVCRDRNDLESLLIEVCMNEQRFFQVYYRDDLCDDSKINIEFMTDLYVDFPNIKFDIPVESLIEQIELAKNFLKQKNSNHTST